MSILKTTSFQILSASMAGQSERTFKTAHRAEFDHVERRPGYLYVRSRAISSRINENFDGFDADEIAKGYQTFMGKPVFVSHHNSNHRRARGAIVAVALHEDHLATGEPDTWVEVLMEVDAVNFPKLAQAIIAGEVARTSMGCDVAYSSCTFCGNKAYTEAEYCKHIPRLKGKRIRRVDAKTGASSMVLVAEQCFGLHFFENSLLVEEPADPSAFCLGTDWVDSDMTPHHASANSMDSSIAYAEAIANIPQRELSTTSASSPDRNLGKQVSLDDEDFFFGQHVSSIAYTGSATPPLHHVGRVVGVGTEQPVGRIVAERNIAGMANDQSFGDWADDLLVSPSVGADGASLSVGQREASIARVEDTPGPKPAFVLTTDGDLRPVALNLGHSEAVIPSHVPHLSTFEAGFILTADSNDLPELKMPPPPYRVNCRNCGQQSVTNKNHPKCESCGDLHVSPVRRASKEAATQEEAERTGPCPHCGGKLFSNGFPGTSPYCGSCQTHIPLKPKASSFGGKRVASLHKRAVNQCIRHYEHEVGPNDLTCPVCESLMYYGTPTTKMPDDQYLEWLSKQPYEARKHAINETIAPPEVDTLRASECPICGSDAYNGEECPVCMFIKPPDMFMDPDLEAAQNADLRQDEAQDGLAVGDQVGNDHLQGQTPVGDDLMAAGQEGDLQCDSCGAVQPGQASAGTDNAVNGAPTTQPTSQPPTQPGAEPPPPVNDESMPLAQGPPEADDVPPAGKELPKPKDGENDDGQDDGSKAETKPKGDPADKGKVESDIDAGKSDTTKPTEDEAVDTLQKDLKPGDPCPVCDGKGKLQPKADDKKDDQKVEDKDSKDDKEDGPPWQKGDNSSKEVKAQSSLNHDTPGVSDMAAPTVKVLASHQAEIRRLKAENAQLRRSVNYIAAAVGITRFADDQNPAEPIPQPAGGAPSETSEEAMNAATRVNVQEIGSTPVNGVGADATTTVDQVGGINADTPYSINTEVTTPVSGTETRIPLDKVRTLPEIQFGNPLVPDTAFPLEGPFAEKATLGSKGRTYAALRLARLRKAAGVDETGSDEIVVANAIDTNASLSDGAIAQEIDILTKVVTATQAPTPRQASRRLVPQSSAGVERTIPSVAVGEGLTSFTAAAASDDDAFAFCD